MFFGENEIAVRVPSLLKLLIKEVNLKLLALYHILFYTNNNIFSVFSVSLPRPGLESFLHLPALQCCSLERRGLLLLCFSHSFHVCHFNSHLIVYHQKGESHLSLGKTKSELIVETLMGDPKTYGFNSFWGGNTLSKCI